MLTAQLIERGPLRWTPAGLPALDCRLAQAATVTEDGQPRRIALEVKALAIGAITRPLAAMALGSSAVFAGFLASARNGRGLLFHITTLTGVNPDHPQSSDPPKEVHHAPAQR